MEQTKLNEFIDMIKLDMSQKIVFLLLLGIIGSVIVFVVIKQIVVIKQRKETKKEQPVSQANVIMNKDTIRMNKDKIRQPQFAGKFYPSDKDQLEQDLEQYFTKAMEFGYQVQSTQPIRALIVPHAGYSYSGLVAAVGFNQLNSSAINKVILFGASHQAFL
ncbi:MAG: AmmeMemoRadiSam system protein B, partial [Patescibacteria group bacterium]|nr:AmmeMemoRadiSam system protein B [Patescibacteria group bacterium]